MSRQSAALSSATQHAMSPKLGGKWGTECLSTRFPLPILLVTGYSMMKLIYNSVFFNSFIRKKKYIYATIVKNENTTDSKLPISYKLNSKLCNIDLIT